jgi:hypothetical protein
MMHLKITFLFLNQPLENLWQADKKIPPRDPAAALICLFAKHDCASRFLAGPPP